ncbi:hypothetical protein FJ250_03510 [bacterium]|nr:hypothetical protein [bacterium]
MPDQGVPYGNPERMAWRLALALVVLTAAYVVAAADEEGGANGPWHGVTVTDAGGWTLRDVTLALAADGEGLVIIRADGAEKPLAFADMALVVDADGRDITDEVLTGVPALEPGAEEEPEPREADPRANPEFDVVPPEPALLPGRGLGGGRPPLFAFALDAGGGAADLTGDWFWGLEDGGFAQFGARLAHAERAYLHLLYRHQDAGTRSFAGYGEVPRVVDFTMQSFQLMYGSHTVDRRKSRLRALGYCEAGGGIMRLRAESGGETASSTRFAFAMQAGMWLPATDELTLDLGLHAFYKPGWLDEEEAGGTSLGLQLCLVYLWR